MDCDKGIEFNAINYPYGHCQRHPPTAGIFNMFRLPTTRGSHKCGEFEAKTIKTKDNSSWLEIQNPQGQKAFTLSFEGDTLKGKLHCGEIDEAAKVFFKRVCEIADTAQYPVKTTLATNEKLNNRLDDNIGCINKLNEVYNKAIKKNRIEDKL